MAGGQAASSLGGSVTAYVAQAQARRPARLLGESVRRPSVLKLSPGAARSPPRLPRKALSVCSRSPSPL